MDGDWLILYDEDCGFCQSLLAGLLIWDRSGRLRPLALQRQEAVAALTGLDPAGRMGSWHLVSPSGERYSAGAAFAPVLKLMPGGEPAARLAATFPGASERGYRWVAEHRSLLSKAVPGAAKRRAQQRVRRRERSLE